MPRKWNPGCPCCKGGSKTFCPLCNCPHGVPDLATATYAGKTYTLDGAVIVNRGGYYAGRINTTPVLQPVAMSTSSTTTPCAGGCGNNGDVPTHLFVDADCAAFLLVPYVCGCPTTSPMRSCWSTDDLQRFAQVPAFPATITCGPPFSFAGTLPATVDFARLVCSGFGTNSLPTPGGGGDVRITGDDQTRPRECCWPCAFPKKNLQASILNTLCDAIDGTHVIRQDLAGTLVYDPAAHVTKGDMTHNCVIRDLGGKQTGYKVTSLEVRCDVDPRSGLGSLFVILSQWSYRMDGSPMLDGNGQPIGGTLGFDLLTGAVAAGGLSSLFWRIMDVHCDPFHVHLQQQVPDGHGGTSFFVDIFIDE